MDALTEGDGGFEEALLNAIVCDDTLLDTSQMFQANSATTVVNADDAAYWNAVPVIEPVPVAPVPETIMTELPPPVENPIPADIANDPVLRSWSRKLGEDRRGTLCGRHFDDLSETIFEGHHAQDGWFVVG